MFRFPARNLLCAGVLAGEEFVIRYGFMARSLALIATGRPANSASRGNDVFFRQPAAAIALRWRELESVSKRRHGR